MPSTASTILQSKIYVKSIEVQFANFSPPESPMSDQLGNNSFSERTDGAMLQINPQDAILFTKSGNELVGMVEITNIIQAPVTYKIKTTSPEKFRVRPSTGILSPGANAVINVV
ncbi:hypothetical protein HA402_003290 [Bradysia odoriphaga]|nr:hypothetical protein HA402_003290 [Bradysia odoriphaga]